MSSRNFIKWSRYSLLLITLLLSPCVWSDESYSKMFVFGDSLSDTGNLASVIGDFPSPPYFNNRPSDGLLAIDILAAAINLKVDASLHLVGPAVGTNYSIAGARSRMSSDTPIDLPLQVGAFLANHNGSAPADALYVIFIGGNDAFDASRSGDATIAKDIIDAAVVAEAQQIQKLIDAGAKYFFVVNVVDISVTPSSILLAAALQDPEVLKQASKITKNYNKKLKRALKVIKKHNKIKMVRFDLFEAFKNLLNDAEDAGFTNTTEACFSVITFSFNPGCDFGANIPNYLFLDEVHPSARAHKIIGDLFAGEVE